MDDDVHRALRKFYDLKDRSGGSDGVKVVKSRLFGLRISLCKQADYGFIRFGVLEQRLAAVASDGQRSNCAGKGDSVSDGQDSDYFRYRQFVVSQQFVFVVRQAVYIRRIFLLHNNCLGRVNEQKVFKITSHCFTPLFFNP